MVTDRRVTHAIFFYLRMSLLLLLVAISSPLCLSAADEEVTREELRTVYHAFVDAANAGCSYDTVVDLYTVPKALPAINMLIDRYKAGVRSGISQQRSEDLEKARDEMIRIVLSKLSSLTGGCVEVMDAGRQQGVRLTKGMIIFGVVGAKRTVTSREMLLLFSKHFEEIFSIRPEQMDIRLYDADAICPHWRNASMTQKTFLQRVETSGKQPVSTTPPAQSYSSGPRILFLHANDDLLWQSTGNADWIKSEQLRYGEDTVAEFTLAEITGTDDAQARYLRFMEQQTARSPIELLLGLLEKYDATADFQKRAEIAARCYQDSLHMLEDTEWDEDILTELQELDSRNAKRAFVLKHVSKLAGQSSSTVRNLLAEALLISCEVAIDTRRGKFQGVAHYIQEIINIEEKAALENREIVDYREIERRALENFQGLQRGGLRLILSSVSGACLQDLFTDTYRRDLLVQKLGRSGADAFTKKSLVRIIDLFDRLQTTGSMNMAIEQSPESIRADLRLLRTLTQIGYDTAHTMSTIRLEKSDRLQARESGPKTAVAQEKEKTELELKRQAFMTASSDIRQAYPEYDPGQIDPACSEAHMAHLLKRRIDYTLSELQQRQLAELRNEFSEAYPQSRLIDDVINLGNPGAVRNLITAYRNNLSMSDLAQVAAWEVYSNYQGVNRVIKLEQTYNDADYKTLSRLQLQIPVKKDLQVTGVYYPETGDYNWYSLSGFRALSNSVDDQVYRGFITPGEGFDYASMTWKQRSEALARSILAEVPGDSFGQKRANLYRHYNRAILDMIDTNASVVETYLASSAADRKIELFFRKLSERQVGKDLYHWMTANLNFERIFRNIVGFLTADFKAGRTNSERIKEELRLPAFPEALEKVTGENLELERKIESARLFVVGRIIDKARATLDQAQPLTPKHAVHELETSVSPPVITQDGEVEIGVWSITSGSGEQQQRAPKIEIRKTGSDVQYDAAPAESRPRGVGPDQVRYILESQDEELYSDILEGADADRLNFYVTKLDYDVVMKDDATEDELQRETVSLYLLDSDKPSGSSTARVKMFKRVEITYSEAERARLSEMERLMKRFQLVWEDPDPDNISPWGRDKTGEAAAGQPHIWVHWPDAPLRKLYWMEGTISGGTPTFSQEFGGWVQGAEEFPDKENSHQAGNAFSYEIPFPAGHAGDFSIDGRITAYDLARVPEEKPAGSEHVIAEYPYHAQFSINAMPRKAEGTVAVTTTELAKRVRNDVEMMISIEGCQDGSRPAEITIGGKKAFTMLDSFNGRASLSLQMSDVGSYTSATVSFSDYGQTATVDVPLTVRDFHSSSEHLNETEVQRISTRLEQYMLNEEANLDAIAAAHGSYAAHCYRADPEEYIRHKEIELEYRERLIEAVQNPAWEGYKGRTIDMEIDGRHVYVNVQSTEDAQLRQQAMAFVLDSTREVLFDSLSGYFDFLIEQEDLTRAESVFARARSIADTLADTERNRQRRLSFIRGAYTQLAELTFRSTGDTAAACDYWEKAEAARAEQDGSVYSSDRQCPWQSSEGF